MVAKDPKNHMSEMISDEEHSTLYSKSSQKFLIKYNDIYDESNIDKYHEWTNMYNYRVTHFGIKPYLLPISSTCINNLHLRLYTMRSIWDYIREYLEMFDFNLNQDFTSIL